MFAVLDRVFRIRSSVALVQEGDRIEFFKTNVRESIRLKINYSKFFDLLYDFDGRKTIGEIFGDMFDVSEVESLVELLNNENIIIEVDCSYILLEFEKKRRVINTLEEFFLKTSEVINALYNLEEKTVLIVGLGAVGTWVIHTLALSGVKNFIIVDDDIVEISNLHRQDLFFHSDIGKYKVDVIQERLNEIGNFNLQKIKKKMDENFLKNENLDFSLAINCADFPSVDMTTEIIGSFCMEKKIPHLVGGGYNLHLTLIGQSVIPGVTACVKCFQTTLEKLNTADLDGVKKLHRPNRKIGSFGPLCSISASITSFEAFKILIGANSKLTTSNKRVEFRIREMDFSISKIEKNPNCEWCGKNGKFMN